MNENKLKKQEKSQYSKRRLILNNEKAGEENAITLVALVITIIIIIILATVAMNAAFGDNGLIKQAQLSKDMASNSTTAEGEDMNRLMQEYANVMAEDGEINPPGPTVPEEWDTTKVTPVLSEDNIYVPVPNGFTASTVEGENNVSEGFVIKQGSDGSLITGVNEFVWIPVDETSLREMYNTTGGEKTLTGVTTKTSIYSNLRVRSGDSYSPTIPGQTSGIKEPDVLSSYDTDSSYTNVLGYANTQAMADAMVAEYNATYASIQKYKGFYIGRYELTGSMTSPTVQKGQAVLTSDIAGNWYQLYKACTSVVNGDEYGAQSEMIYGNQWDEVMDWLVDTGMSSDDVNVDSSSWGNYNTASGGTGEKQNSGSNPAWQANNIYDLAGNCGEWTQEVHNTLNRVIRGRSLQCFRLCLSSFRPLQRLSG